MEKMERSKKHGAGCGYSSLAHSAKYTTFSQACQVVIQNTTFPTCNASYISYIDVIQYTVSMY